MPIFITGTDTNVGKTIISSWICSILDWGYFKPIQTGTDNDSIFVSKVAKVPIYEPIFSFPEPISPHAAAKLNNKAIDISRIQLPRCHENFTHMVDRKQDQGISPSTKVMDKIIVEGAGGVLVPLQEDGIKMIDLIQFLGIPVIVVSRANLGTINHTLLTLEALRSRKIKVLGVVVNSTEGEHLEYNSEAIAKYGSVELLMNFPYLKDVSRESLLKIQMPEPMKHILQSQ